MHCLTGTYLKSHSDELMAEGKDRSSCKQLFPLKIVIPPNKSRLLFFGTAREMNLWT